jgi:hypothetical protein
MGAACVEQLTLDPRAYRCDQDQDGATLHARPGAKVCKAAVQCFCWYGSRSKIICCFWYVIEQLKATA